MATEAPSRTMTLDEFRDLPEEDGIDRELMLGELVETEMTKRNRWRAKVETVVARILDSWAIQQSPKIVEVFSGEVGCEFPQQDSSVGIDVAVFSIETIRAQCDDSPYIVGAPIVAIEVISPSTRHEQTQKKIDVYLKAGVKSVWNIDPHFRTLTVHKPGESPRMYSGDAQVEDADHLPGFSVSVAAFFESSVFN